MKPNKKGSVGINKPTLSVNSSILTDNGVKKARLRKTILE
jgi:hypothetical protein